MQIAIASQNLREVTPHVGRCRRFWIYDVEDGQVTGRELLALEHGDSLHDRRHEVPVGLASCEALIAQSMGPGLAKRLAQHAIRAVCTEERDPEKALRAYLEGFLLPLPVSGEGGCGKH